MRPSAEKLHRLWFYIFGSNISILAGLLSVAFLRLLGRRCFLAALLSAIGIAGYTLLVGSRAKTGAACPSRDRRIRTHNTLLRKTTDFEAMAWRFPFYSFIIVKLTEIDVALSAITKESKGVILRNVLCDEGSQPGDDRDPSPRSG